MIVRDPDTKDGLIVLAEKRERQGISSFDTVEGNRPDLILPRPSADIVVAFMRAQMKEAGVASWELGAMPQTIWVEEDMKGVSERRIIVPATYRTLLYLAGDIHNRISRV